MWTEVRSNQIRKRFFIILMRGYSVASNIAPPEGCLAAPHPDILSGPRKFVERVWNVMAHAQKPDFVSAKRTSPFKSAGASVRSTACSRGVRISGSNVGYTKCRGSEGYWLPTLFAAFPFTSPAVRHRVPSYFNWTLQSIRIPTLKKYSINLTEIWYVEERGFSREVRRLDLEAAPLTYSSIEVMNAWTCICTLVTCTRLNGVCSSEPSTVIFKPHQAYSLFEFLTYCSVCCDEFWDSSTK